MLFNPVTMARSLTARIWSVQSNHVGGTSTITRSYCCEMKRKRASSAAMSSSTEALLFRGTASTSMPLRCDG